MQPSITVIKSKSMSEILSGKTILITGAARRLGRLFALACAHAGADVVIHHSHSEEEAEAVRQEINGLGRQAWIFQADFNDPQQAGSLIRLVNEIHPFVWSR